MLRFAVVVVVVVVVELVRVGSIKKMTKWKKLFGLGREVLWAECGVIEHHCFLAG